MNELPDTAEATRGQGDGQQDPAGLVGALLGAHRLGRLLRLDLYAVPGRLSGGTSRSRCSWRAAPGDAGGNIFMTILFTVLPDRWRRSGSTWLHAAQAAKR